MVTGLYIFHWLAVAVHAPLKILAREDPMPPSTDSRRAKRRFAETIVQPRPGSRVLDGAVSVFDRVPSSLSDPTGSVSGPAELSGSWAVPTIITTARLVPLFWGE